MTPSDSKFPLILIDPISGADPEKVLGYYATSTAKINIEDRRPSDAKNPLPEIQKIAQYLVASPSPEITISIHGYATSHQPARERTDKIYHYAQQICRPKTHVLFGYLWPSENPVQDDSNQSQPLQPAVWKKVQYALQALPTALIGTFVNTLLLLLVSLALLLGAAGDGGMLAYLAIAIIPAIAVVTLLKIGDAEKLLPWLPIGVGLTGLILTWIAQQDWGQLILTLVSSLLGFVFSIIFTLVGLRLTAYLRDQYRAANYAVMDLVDLIRQLDQEILKSNHDQPLRQRVKLNFLGHSMGCFVVTNTIRILSDVFDPQAVQEIPDSDLGDTLRLGRLVLAAADISAESIMPGRSNTLQSSLRRCEEAYLFTNEGDLALRLASTAANYFSFPTRTRFLGYRLGNLTAKHFESYTEHQNYKLQDFQYGIVNRSESQANSVKHDLHPIYQSLEIRSSSQEHRSLQDLNAPPLRHPDEPFSAAALVNRFTVFDCTDYCDDKLPPGETLASSSSGNPQPILSRSLQQAALNLADYLRLSIDFFLTGKIDTHGGYFDGQFSQQLMFDLSLLGFAPLLLSYLADLKDRTPQQFQSLASEQQWQLLNHFDQGCREKKLQVLLSPQRLEQFMSSKNN
ncbi:MAG: alpha/beta hydrolase [Aphanocapsa sp. GSE-SYN-MK-11-07L]|jgi:pimeloyl-ACP methyl ester carboxylesterase|nr:alpha/beta hydrolase [Aphanocapsa sp. GSE-SYN-MK-11-07L]